MSGGNRWPVKEMVRIPTCYTEEAIEVRALKVTMPGIVPQGDKVTRMEAECARIEAGHVVLPRDAPWLAVFLNELLAFPNGRHDDQVDSVSQFLNWAWRRATRTARVGIIPPELIELEDI